MKNKKIQTASYIIITLLISLIFASKNSYAEHTLSLSTSSIQEIEVSPSGDGVTIREAELNVTTTCHAGYHLSLSTTVNDNNLYLDGSANNNSPGSYFSPSDGINSLISSNNTWGFYFSDSNEVPTKNSIFRPVPTLDNSITLRTPAQTASSSLINDNLFIYYGVKVANNTLAGQYKMTEDENHNSGTIVYYATLPEDCFQYTVIYNPTGISNGTTVIGTGNVNSQTITEGIATNLTTEVYGNPTIDGVTYYFAGWNTAQDGTGTQYASGEQVTDLTSAGDFITLYAQWISCPQGEVCYHKNNSNAEGNMSHQTATSNTSITLQPSNYLLQSHGFAGWSEDKEASSKLANHEVVAIYGPNETIAIGDLTSRGLSLYAVWLEAKEALQTWEGCNTLEINDVIALQDLRDGNTYSVAKLADGQCWITENMRINDTVDAQDMLSGSSSLGQDFSVLPASSTNWNTSNSTLVQFNNINYAEGKFSYGNYYSWPATVATTTSYQSGTTSVSTSICPTGWRLPKGGTAFSDSNNDYYSLIKSLTGDEPNVNQATGHGYYNGAQYSNIIRSYPNNFVYSGRWDGDESSNRNDSGFYWTATSYGAGVEAYFLYLNNTMVRPGNGYGGKYYGHVFRCIAGN